MIGVAANLDGSFIAAIFHLGISLWPDNIFGDTIAIGLISRTDNAGATRGTREMDVSS
jgi:hypothetical protein